MNDKLRRIDPLIRRAEERKDAVAREFAQRTRQLANQEQRLGELLRYSEEYAQWPHGGSLAPAALANREAFRARLSEAVQTQRGQVEQARQQTEFERARLALASRDAKVMEQLAASYVAEQRQIDEKREQKAMDDHAVRAYRHQRNQEPLT